MNETVRRFLPMVDFLEQILGKNSEIVLHDFSDPDHAIVDIRNGIVSGRKVGGPATDLALKIMHDGKYRDLPFITGYEGRGAGGKTLESATYFIREDGEIVGMLCVNTDLSTVRNISAMAHQLMACFDAAPARTEPSPIEVESLSESTQELIDRSISELLESRGQDVASLGQATASMLSAISTATACLCSRAPLPALPPRLESLSPASTAICKRSARRANPLIPWERWKTDHFCRIA